MAKTFSMGLSIADGAQTLEVASLHGREAISELFDFTIAVISPEGDVRPKGLAPGLSASLKLTLGGVEMRAIHGMLEQVDLAIDAASERPTHRVRLVPRAWRAVLVERQKIFMDVSVLDIIEGQLARVGLNGDDIVTSVISPPPIRNFLVQYEETDVAFISRLCEHLGIAYYIDCSESTDRIVFTDHNDGFAHGPETVELSHRLDEPDRVYSLVESGRMIPRVYVVYDYNYRTPDTRLSATKKVETGHGGGVLEYGSHVKTVDETAAIAAIRAEERACRQTVFRGTSSVSRLGAGMRCRIGGAHDMDDRQLLVTSVEHRARRAEDGSALVYKNTFEAIDAAQRFRPERKTPRPRITGVVTGVVIGTDGTTDGDEAQIDEFGRYVVRFHFDGALGALNQRASRPVRKAQPLAGSSEGMHFPLRPGTEVAVAFSNGDPDRPIILGALPNHVKQSVVTQTEASINRIQTNDGIVIQFGRQGSS